jgi:hypothetical protein
MASWSRTNSPSSAASRITARLQQLSKYVAGREKDDRFVRAALAAGLVSPETLTERLTRLPIDEQGKERIRRRIRADARR